jgi:hypothetical protein
MLNKFLSNVLAEPALSYFYGLAQQRYAKSHRILANCLGVKDFGDSGIPKTRPVLVGQFWGLDSDRILKLVLREIILSQNVSPHGVYQMHRFN